MIIDNIYFFFFFKYIDLAESDSIYTKTIKGSGGEDFKDKTM